jgi:hypothetical protein
MMHPLCERPESKQTTVSLTRPHAESHKIPTNEREFSATFAKPPPTGGDQLAGRLWPGLEPLLPEDLAATVALAPTTWAYRRQSPHVRTILRVNLAAIAAALVLLVWLAVA